VLLLSVFGLGVDYLFMALAPTLAWLFVGRVINGLTSASFSTANAYIADVTEPQNRAKAYGMMGAAFGVGFILGPIVGGWLGSYNLRWPFYLSAALALVNWLYGLFVLPESLPPERRSRSLDWKSANPLGSLTLLASKPGLLMLAAVYFLFQLAHNVFPSIFVLFVGHRFGWGPREASFMLVATGIGSIIVQAFLVGPVVKRLGERRALLLGLAFEAIAFAIYALASTPLAFYSGVVFGAMSGLIGPGLQGLMTRRVDGSEQGRLQGANSAMVGIAAILGPGLYLSLLAFAVRQEATLGLPGLPILAACALCLASLGMAWRYARPVPGTTEDISPA